MSKTLCIFGLCLNAVVGEVTHSQDYVLFEGLNGEEIALYALHAVEGGVEARDAAIYSRDIQAWKKQYSPAYVQCMARRLTVQLEHCDAQHVGLPLEVLIGNVSTHCLSFMEGVSPVLREDGTQYRYADGSRLYYLETTQGLTIIEGFSD